jgi:hypothetical protein
VIHWTWSSYLEYSVCSLSFSLHQDYVSRLQKSLFRPLCCVARFSCDLIMLMMHHPQKLFTTPLKNLISRVAV